MKVLADTYKELASRINHNVPQIKWIDLWRNQINFLENEYGFPFPAVFLSFRANQMNDLPGHNQNIDTSIDLYLAYETLADTYHGAVNQQSALEFFEILEKLNTCLHASGGDTFTGMRRHSFTPIDTTDGILLYRVTYNATLIDRSGNVKNSSQYELMHVKEYKVKKD